MAEIADPKLRFVDRRERSRDCPAKRRSRGYVTRFETQLFRCSRTKTGSGRERHIAAANLTNIPYEQMWVDPDANTKLAEKKVQDRHGMALKDLAGLKQLYKGIDPKKEVIAY